MNKNSRQSRAGRTTTLLMSVFLLLSLSVNTALANGPGLDPLTVEALVFPGESHNVNKTVSTPTIPPKLDVCLLEDETGSFGDDIANLQTAAPSIYASITAAAPDSWFGVAGFRDYGDAWVYRLISALNPAEAAWLAGVALLTAAGGGDIPEAQYDAIVAATGPGDRDCGWRADSNVTRVLLVATDAPFHVPPTTVNNQATTIAALAAQNIRVIGLKAPGAAGELDALAAATGGSVQALSSDGANIAAAILAGLSALPVEVSMASDCVAPISTVFAPPTQSVTSGTDALFVETITVAAGAAGGTYQCKDWALLNGEPMVDAEGAVIYENKTIHVPGIDLQPPTATNELLPGASHTVTATITAGDYGPVSDVAVEFSITAGPNAGGTGSGTTNALGEVTYTYGPPNPVSPADLGQDTIQASFTDGGTVIYGSDSATKDWVDTTPPIATCTPTVNPDGNNEPKAPGKGGKGQNQDGFYQTLATDIVWPDADLKIYVTDTGSGTVFGPYPVGTRIKYTEANATPIAKPMGGNNGTGGNATAVDFHIIGNGDASVTAVDGSGNVSDPVMCLVPPPPM